MTTLAEVFARYGPAYLDRYGPALLPSHRRALNDVLHCRTEQMGGQVYRCPHCGSHHYVYHSCRNRSCPQCHETQSRDWLEQRRSELLNTPYFHVVFTVPEALHASLRSRQIELYNVLMQAAAQALIELAGDPRYVGGQVGVLAVLHTWGRTLSYHPHVHCLVTGGGWETNSREWRSSRGDYLVPVRALSVLFRRRFRERAETISQTLPVPATVWRTPWVVFCEPVRGGPGRILSYLGRYVHHIAISNDRILSADNGLVRFRYQDLRDGQGKVMTLSAEEFIRRYLQHVLPQGFHKVRYYGLWAPGHRPQLRQLQLLLGTPAPPTPDAARPLGPWGETPTGSATAPPPGRVCPSCGQGILIRIGRLPRYGRAPP